jgi:hypothetical protein
MKTWGTFFLAVILILIAGLVASPALAAPMQGVSGKVTTTDPNPMESIWTHYLTPGSPETVYCDLPSMLQCRGAQGFFKVVLGGYVPDGLIYRVYAFRGGFWVMLEEGMIRNGHELPETAQRPALAASAPFTIIVSARGETPLKYFWPLVYPRESPVTYPHIIIDPESGEAAR